MASPELFVVQFLKGQKLFSYDTGSPALQERKHADLLRPSQRVPIKRFFDEGMLSQDQTLLKHESDQLPQEQRQEQASNGSSASTTHDDAESQGSTGASRQTSGNERQATSGSADSTTSSRQAPAVKFGDEMNDRKESMAPDGTEPNWAILEEEVLNVLEKLNVEDMSWMEGPNHSLEGEDGESLTTVQVMFSTGGGRQSEAVLQKLQELGIGEHIGSSIWVTSLIVRLPAPLEKSDDDIITSRLTVQQVISSVRAAATLSLDFILLCFAASIIAVFGLARDDAVATIASMLVSPLMGPILAFTFGTVVRDRDLLLLGFRNELWGLAICIGTGFIAGLICGAWANEWDWPSQYMSSRGTALGLAVGVGIALPSGIGVALSVLGNNTSSLVGVAISASLLPPAVNAGMNFGFAIVATAMGQDGDDHADVAKVAEIGALSLCLTLMNIAIIYIMGIAFLFVKSVTPDILGATPFWKHAVPVYRKLAERHDRAEDQQSWAGVQSTYGNVGLGFASDARSAGLAPPKTKEQATLKGKEAEKMAKVLRDAQTRQYAYAQTLDQARRRGGGTINALPIFDTAFAFTSFHPRGHHNQPGNTSGSDHPERNLQNLQRNMRTMSSTSNLLRRRVGKKASPEVHRRHGGRSGLGDTHDLPHVHVSDSSEPRQRHSSEGSTHFDSLV